MRSVIIIPARYASTRLPGKPLLRATGKYLIQHVYERAARAKKADAVIVATDDPRIEAAVLGFGGQVARTRRDHPTGTDRVAEVARGLSAEIIVNVQGDEPLIEPAALDTLIDLMNRRPDSEMATLASPIRDRETWLSPNCVKVVCDSLGRALYFSRSPIPFVRDGEPDFAADSPRFLQHLGVYAYRRDYLLHMATLPAGLLESLEKLEQLRVLAHGGAIHVGVVDQPSRGVDTFADYDAFCRQYARLPRVA